MCSLARLAVGNKQSKALSVREDAVVSSAGDWGGERLSVAPFVFDDAVFEGDMDGFVDFGFA